MAEKVLLRHLDVPDIRKLDVYLAHGGYEAARQALTTLKPEEVTEQVKASNLRGRGGAGFVAGVKWGFLPKDSPKPVYLCCNADESEPGTFKDRAIMEWNTHILLEGILIAGYAIKSHTAYIYIRGEFVLGAKRLEEAIAEAYAKGFLGKNIFGTGYDLDVYVHRGAGAYICGEETGLIESLEGKRAYPRIKPPFPAVYGLFGSPTIVQNVETLACVPSIIKNGPAWFKAIGPETGPGPKIYGVSGHVEKPGLYELPMGMPLRTVEVYVSAGIGEAGVSVAGDPQLVLLGVFLHVPGYVDALVADLFQRLLVGDHHLAEVESATHLELCLHLVDIAIEPVKFLQNLPGGAGCVVRGREGGHHAVGGPGHFVDAKLPEDALQELLVFGEGVFDHQLVLAGLHAGGAGHVDGQESHAAPRFAQDLFGGGVLAEERHA